ncbi:MAG: hypothetical protein ACXVJ7_07210 [Acidimicrobiia bacterium]
MTPDDPAPVDLGPFDRVAEHSGDPDHHLDARRAVAADPGNGFGVPATDFDHQRGASEAVLR